MRFSYGLLLSLITALFNSMGAEARLLPRPLPSHPGNVFLAGEDVVVEVTPNQGPWRLVDYDGKELSAASVSGALLPKATAVRYASAASP